MKRLDFIRTMGLAGAGLTLPLSRTEAMPPGNPPDACVLIPTETAGPFPWDLTDNSYYFRQDIREDRTGVPFTVKLRVIGQDNCLPMSNVRVNIWHCDKDGNYSAYGTEAGKTWLRGYQITDSNGEVSFTTIFPGWYTGRICHIHFQVFVSNNYAAISQLSFDIAKKNAIYAANSSLYTKGADPLSFNQDNIFSDGYTYQLASLEDDGTDSYTSFLEVTVKGTGTSGVSNQEKLVSNQFKLGQNFPNPYNLNTNIPFQLNDLSDVSLLLFNLQGDKVKEISLGKLSAGDHIYELNLEKLGLPVANYAYQLNIKNKYGNFTNCKLMSHL